MQFFTTPGKDGVRIAYEVRGEGEPVLLVHGFASNGRVNWVGPGWASFLNRHGFQVIMIDNRGHGESEKLYDTGRYGAEQMAQDAGDLLDHLKIRQCHVMGYSMGARITAFMAIYHPEKVKSAVLAGLADNMVRGFGRGDAIAAALAADQESDEFGAEAKAFRRFASKTGSDLKALSACMLSRGHKVTPQMLGQIACPVLVVAGSADDVAGPVEPLVAAIGNNARGIVLPGRDHMNAVGDKTYKQAVAEFWTGQGA